jgi:tetratricopeptide (TPR) repeat protein
LGYKLPLTLFIILAMLIFPLISLADDSYKEGLALFRSGGYEEAIVKFREYLVEHPDDQQAILGLWKSYYKLVYKFYKGARYKEAVQIADEAVNFVPEPYLGYVCNLQGLSYDLSGDIENALKCYRRVTEILPEFAWGFNNLGYTHLRLGYFDEAIEALSRAIELEPYGQVAVYAYNSRGVAYERKGFKDDAIIEYKASLNLDPEYEIAKLNWERLSAEQEAEYD